MYAKLLSPKYYVKLFGKISNRTFPLFPNHRFIHHFFNSIKNKGLVTIEERQSKGQCAFISQTNEGRYDRLSQVKGLSWRTVGCLKERASQKTEIENPGFKISHQFQEGKNLFLDGSGGVRDCRNCL